MLEREAVIGLLLGLVVIKIGRLERVRCEGRFHRQQDVGKILELSLKGPFALRLHVIGVRIGNIRHGAGVERCYRLRNHVLDGILRQFDLDAGFRLEFFHHVEQRVVFGLVEALAPPDRDRVLGARGRRGV